MSTTSTAPTSSTPSNSLRHHGGNPLQLLKNFVAARRALVNHSGIRSNSSSASSLSSLCHSQSDSCSKNESKHELDSNQTSSGSFDSCFINAFTYKGLEVVLTATTSPLTKKSEVLIISTRLKSVLQKLALPADANTVVAITSHPVNGMICLALDDGRICTYFPKPAKPAPSDGTPEYDDGGIFNNSSQESDGQYLFNKESDLDHRDPITLFGKYFWVNGVIASSRDVFYAKNEKRDPAIFCRTKQCRMYPTKRVNISISVDYKLLVGHRDQLAIFDVSPFESPDYDAILNWTVRLRSHITIAKISGDGLAIAYVLQEGSDTTIKHGVYTFIRERDIVSEERVRSLESMNKSLKTHERLLTALFYRAGPFLVHSSSVTRISFRGLGFQNIKVVEDDDEEGLVMNGNDLLLTCCAEDGTLRIFAQSNWKQLLQWETPPGRSRADWIQGMSGFTVGELDPPTSASSVLGTTNENTSDDSRISDASLGVDFRNNISQAQKVAPSCAAGAWISELTFRGSIPALRLSRLSFVKSGGNQFSPVHFESVTSILPPTSITAESVLHHSCGDEESGLAVQGFWPAWDPLEARNTWSASDISMTGKSTATRMGNSGSGSSGSSSANLQSLSLSGTCMPPSELKLFASDSVESNIVIMEYHLWSDKNLDELELGSPLIHKVQIKESLPASSSGNAGVVSVMNDVSRFASVDFNSSRLCAFVTEDRKQIELTMRSQGTMNVLRDASGCNDVSSSSTTDRFIDLSLTPLPLFIANLTLPNNVYYDDSILFIEWWCDENFGDSCRLLVVTKLGTLLVYAFPPLWTIFQPTDPSFDTLTESLNSTDDLLSPNLSASGFTERQAYEPHNNNIGFHIYEVEITPHPEFGLGLRLEPSSNGRPAVVGSFKKHPLSGGSLPAEKTAKIQIGDEVIRVNNVSLEGKKYDDIIETMRKFGSECRGSSLNMVFRSKAKIQDAVEVNSFGGKKSRNESPWKPNPNNCDRFGSIISIVQNALPKHEGSKSSQSCPTAFAILPPLYGQEVPSCREALLGALLLLHVFDGILVVSWLTISHAMDEEKSGSITELSRLDLIHSERNRTKCFGMPIRLDIVATMTNGWIVTGCDNNGVVAVVSVKVVQFEGSSLPPSLEMTLLDILSISGLKSLSSIGKPPSIVRGHSIDLLAIAQIGSDCVHVWSSNPAGKVTGITTKELHATAYSSSIVRVRDHIINFDFVSSGYLDAFPWLVFFYKNTAELYHFDLKASAWYPLMDIKYSTTNDSLNFRKPLPLISRDLLNPLDTYPHLIECFRSIVTKSDELSYFRNDWHPDSVIANICTNVHGVSYAFTKYLYGLYYWLLGCVQSEEYMRLTVNCAPINIFTDVGVTQERFIASANSASKSIASVAEIESNQMERSKSDSNFETVLDAFLDRIVGSVVEESDRGKTEVSNKFSKDFILAMSATKKPLDPLTTNVDELMKNMHRDNRYLLWSLGKMLLRKRDLRSVDAQGQLVCFSIDIMRQLERIKIPDEPSNKKDTASDQTYFGKPLASVAPTQTVTAESNTISSAACLAALLSNTQSDIIQVNRIPDEKIDWVTAKSIMIPLWLRSDKLLRSIAEEIALEIYRKTRDVLECSIFLIASGNIKKLKALAATDRSDSGKKFLSFIMDQDFASTRGRAAAEKNAFSLLRKRRYLVSAAFFLLPQPPMLKNAVEIILNQVGDPALAVMISRLVDESTVKGQSDGSSSLTIGSNFSLRSMGGGGGFASTGTDREDRENNDTDDVFSEWKPLLSDFTRYLLSSRCLSIFVTDPCLQAVTLLWLNRPNDAALCLIGRTFSTYKSFDDVPVRDSSRFLYDESDFSYQSNAIKRILSRLNAVMNFTCRPFLLDKMHAPYSVRAASTLAVSSALNKRGMEISSINLLSRMPTPNDCLKKEPTFKASISQNDRRSLLPTKIVSASAVESSGVSSIFDTYAIPPTKSATDVPKTLPLKKESTPSIFDAFDVQPPKKAQVSSIFDAFDVPPPKTVPLKQQAPSSIFDTFDMRPPKVASKKDKTPSIFDEFDVQPPKSVVNNHISVGKTTIESSFSDHSSETGENKQRSNNAASKFALEDEPSDSIITLPTELHALLALDEKLRLTSAARRLLREIASIVNPFYGDVEYEPIERFHRLVHPLLPARLSNVLHETCKSDTILSSLKMTLDSLALMSGTGRSNIIQEALFLLGCPKKPRRIVFSVLLLCLQGRPDLIEDTLRIAARDQISRCDIFVVANDDLIFNGRTKHYASSQYFRRHAVVVSWQLEFCLWLHRGSAFPMSATAFKEVTIGVRVGLLIASWGRCHEMLENLIKQEPDCLLEYNRGKQLWNSTKMIPTILEKDKKLGTTATGGWEFLVDCRRKEATEMLRDRKTGSFLIRPHADDQGTFTLSFKTNLSRSDSSCERERLNDELIEGNFESLTINKDSTQLVDRNDVVQHAIIRLSDAGFRCGHFGPYSTLSTLLQEVSNSLPFELLFDEPPTKGIIRTTRNQPSPNAAFIRKMLLHGNSDHYKWNSDTRFGDLDGRKLEGDTFESTLTRHRNEDTTIRMDQNFRKRNIPTILGTFSQLLTLSEIRKQICAIAAAEYDSSSLPSILADSLGSTDILMVDDRKTVDYIEEERSVIASRMVQPLLNWCRSLECAVVNAIAPSTNDIWRSKPSSIPIAVTASDTEIEAIPSDTKNAMSRGDALIKLMIQPASGVVFRTLRVGEGGQSAVVVLFRRSEAITWLVSIGIDKTEEDAGERLHMMERRRVIEKIDLSEITSNNKGLSVTANLENYAASVADGDVRYRVVDPWEVETMESSTDGELRGVALGRGHYVPFSVGNVARASETYQRYLGGLHLLALWNTVKGGVCLTKALASVHPPWERDAGGDSPIGFESQFSSYASSFSAHLYRNALYRRLRLPQRFMAIIQVELLDLKNLTSPTGTSSAMAFALLRLKRPSSNASLTLKARTLDSVCTDPKKIGKASGPNAPGTWGSIVSFRFPLPEDVDCDGVSFDQDREALFKGVPSVLQVTVYDKKFVTDSMLGGADVNLDGLPGGGEIVEWVPLRSTHNSNITWFTRIRLSLRFELMCMEDVDSADSPSTLSNRCPSAAMKKIRFLSSFGGVHEDAKGYRKSSSLPDFADYFDSISS